MVKLNIYPAIMQLAERMPEFRPVNISPAFSQSEARKAMKELKRLGKIVAVEGKHEVYRRAE